MTRQKCWSRTRRISGSCSQADAQTAKDAKTRFHPFHFVSITIVGPHPLRYLPQPHARSTFRIAVMISQVSSNASSLTTKERHYAQLAAKLGTLANSFETTKQHLNLAAEQAFYMRKLGIAQAST